MKRIITTILIIALGHLSAIAQYEWVLDSMLLSIQNVKTLSCTIKSSEKLEDRTAVVEQNVKASFTPLQCNIEFIQPREGAKVVYSEGQNDGELRYIPNGFPYFDINLDPLGSLARRNNHHTIFEVGFQYLASILQKESSLNRELLKITKKQSNNQSIYVLEAKHTDYSTRNYKMKENETVRDIAMREKISEYLIVSLNDNLNSFNDWTSETIKLPTYYCYEIHIEINPSNWLPNLVQLKDEKGVFEQYEYNNVQVNPPLKPELFELN